MKQQRCCVGVRGCRMEIKLGSLPSDAKAKRGERGEARRESQEYEVGVRAGGGGGTGRLGTSRPPPVGRRQSKNRFTVPFLAQQGELPCQQ